MKRLYRVFENKAGEFRVEYRHVLWPFWSTVDRWVGSLSGSYMAPQFFPSIEAAAAEVRKMEKARIEGEKRSSWRRV